MRQFENVISTLTLGHDGKKGVLVLRGPARDLIAIRDQVRKDNWTPKVSGNTNGVYEVVSGIDAYEVHGDEGEPTETFLVERAFARPRHNISALWWTAMTGLLAILITGTMLVLKHF